MSQSLNMSMIDTELIMRHKELVRRLEAEYTNHIKKLLKQKSLILDKLQQLFIEQRNRIKQTLSDHDKLVNQSSISIRPKDKSQSVMSEKEISDKMTSLIQDLNSENIQNESEKQSFPSFGNFINRRVIIPSATVYPKNVSPGVRASKGTDINNLEGDGSHILSNGDCVWAKYLDYPWWPGQIKSSSNNPKDRISVKWFGGVQVKRYVIHQHASNDTNTSITKQ